MNHISPVQVSASKLAIAILVLSPMLVRPTEGNQYSLTDPGFNVGSQPLLPAGTFTFDRWEVEAATLVAGAQAGVAPFEGNGMLRINVTGGVASQVWQFLNLAPLATQINAGLVTAEAYAFFNSTQSHMPRAGLRLSGRTGVNPNFFLRPLTSNSVISKVLDGNAGTWEQLSIGSMLIPPGTNLLEIELAYGNGLLPPVGFAFADLAYVCLHVVPEPTALGMTVLGTIILGISRRRARSFRFTTL